MLHKSLCVCLLMYCIIGCTTDSTNEDMNSLFPTPAILKEKDSPKKDVNIDAGNPPVAVEIFAGEVIVEPIVAAVDKQNSWIILAPQITNSTVNHGDIAVDPDVDSFVFTFDEDIAGTNFIKLIDNTNRTSYGMGTFRSE